MARLTPADRKAFLELHRIGWRQTPEEFIPRAVDPTVEARQAYCRWASEAARFFKGRKPVRFEGSNWKL
jgi:hypothetical protein